MAIEYRDKGTRKTGIWRDGGALSRVIKWGDGTRRWKIREVGWGNYFFKCSLHLEEVDWSLITPTGYRR